MYKTIAEMKTVRSVITPSELLEHWQGHRTLTRRLIKAFPEEAFFTYSIGGMRPFVEMTMELIGIAGPGIQQIATGLSVPLNEHFEHGNKKSAILELWDHATVQIDYYGSQIGLERFHESIKTFGEYESKVYEAILYFIDNEIHHRGQGYVYLRSLGVEPPAFLER